MVAALADNAAMDSILTLLVDPAEPILTAGHTTAARRAIEALGGDTGPADWLDDGIACNIAVDGLHPEQAEAAAMAALPGLPIDIVCALAQRRRKRLLLADMDSTIVTGETLDDMAALAGLADKIAPITARAMNGEIDFTDALRERVAMLAGLDAATLEAAYEAVALTPGARTLVRTMRADGAYTALVSGGFKYFTSRVANAVGFHTDRANDLVIEDGRLTGHVIEPVLDKDSKLATLIAMAGERNLSLEETATVGDGANDLPMLLAAGLGVAFHAKPSVKAAARVRVAHGNLTALLYIQGYRREAFVTD
jgi:phosphoserine phosphatase